MKFHLYKVYKFNCVFFLIIYQRGSLTSNHIFLHIVHEHNTDLTVTVYESDYDYYYCTCVTPLHLYVSTKNITKKLK